MSAFSRLYQRRVFPWLNDLVCSEPAIAQLRGETLAVATGRVIEIGFGTGLNLPHYPAGVSELVAVEPNAGMVDRSEARVRAAVFPVRIVNGSAEALPFHDGEFDSAVSTLTLCSVADPALALAELRRVLHPGGRLLLLEHGLAPEPGVPAGSTGSTACSRCWPAAATWYDRWRHWSPRKASKCGNCVSSIWRACRAPMAGWHWPRRSAPAEAERVVSRRAS